MEMLLQHAGSPEGYAINPNFVTLRVLVVSKGALLYFYAFLMVFWVGVGVCVCGIRGISALMKSKDI